MTANKFIRWLKIVIVLFCLILIFIGFAFGYIYNNYKSGACTERPLSYAVERLNDMNNANFTCSCSAGSSNIEPFSFDEHGLIKNQDFILGTLSIK